MSWTVLVQSDGSYSALSPIIHGDIALSTNTNTVTWVSANEAKSSYIEHNQKATTFSHVQAYLLLCFNGGFFQLLLL